jgi:putative transposase
MMRSHCAHTRFVWNLAVEQHQQQALRDFSKAMKAFFDPGNPASRPSWRKAGRNDGFRIVSVRPGHVRRLSGNTGEFWVPEVGWARFRWSRAVPEGVKSYRVTRDRAGRWHVAFATIPAPVPAPGNGRIAGIDRGIAVSAALSTGELLHAPSLTGRERTRLRRLERKLARARRFDVIRVEDLKITNMTRSAKGTRENPGRNVRAKAGLNRGILRSRWGTSQARFVCTASGYAGNADVNAARNIAAGHAVIARGGCRDAGPVNREPHLLASFTGCE